jgi:hypothetical protein
VDIIRALFASGVGMLLLLVGFIGAGWVAEYWARSQTSLAMQYAGLGLYVLVEVVIFLSAAVVHRREFQRPVGIADGGGVDAGLVSGANRG